MGGSSAAEDAGAGMGSSSVGGVKDSGGSASTVDSGGVDGSAGAGGADGGAVPTLLPTSITGLTVVGASPAGSLRCDSDGTCYKNTTGRANLTGTLNPGDGIFKMAPNGQTFALIGDNATPPAAPMAGLVTGLAVDGHGNVFACGLAYGGNAGTVPYQLAAGATQWTPIGTGLGNVRNVVCGEALVSDGSTLFVGDSNLWELPAGKTMWVDDGGPGSLGGSSVSATVPFKGDVYVATGASSDHAYVLKAGAAAFVALADPVQTLSRLAVDSAGNLLGHTPGELGGGSPSPIFRLAPGDAKWTKTTGLAANTRPSNIVIDADDNAYTVGYASASATTISLLKLAAGSLEWAKLFDVQGLDATETCDGKLGDGFVDSLADDHLGHLVLQCTSTFLRSQP